MFKNYKILFSILLVVLLVIGTTAATWNMSIARFDSLWVGDTDDTSNVTVGDDDAYIKGTLEVDGAVRFDGAATFSSTVAISGTLTATIERAIDLPLQDFILVGDNGSTAAALTASTTPGFEIIDAIPALVWADGETSPAAVTFRIPADYSSGGAFRLLVSGSDTSGVIVDFDVYVNVDGSAFDVSASAQTQVTSTAANTTNDVITLTPVTDFASLSAGDHITLRYWRYDTDSDYVGQAESKAVSFYYTATQ